MQKKSKKIISVIAVVICLFMTFSSSIAYADNTITKGNAIVLVLDRSGSMDGQPMTNLKEACEQFCRKVLDNNSNNKIAIVSFANGFDVQKPTNSFSDLIRFITSINASGGTYMKDAINEADKLLKDSSLDGYSKSIVIMADGEPFDPQETETKAKSLFDVYNIFSIGFFSSSDSDARTLMKNIQNKGYFEATSVNELIEQFVKVAEEILNPFTIKLSHKNTDKSENAQNKGSYTYKYEISAEITNGNSKQTNNVKASIDLGQMMTLSSGSNQTIDLGTLGAGETKTITWNIEMPMVVLGVTMYDIYSVTSSSDNTTDITVSDKIIIDDDDNYNAKNNELNFSKDVWNFGNYTVDKIPLTTEDYKALMYGRSNTEKEYIDNIVNSPHGGQCYGMSTTTVLSKMNIISISNLQENVNCLHDVKKNEKAKSLIGYYHVFSRFTFTNEKGEDIFLWNLENKTDREKISTITTLAQNVKNGGCPFVLRFELPDNNGHAVVAYAYEAGVFRKNGKSYSHRILIYDCNYPKWNENSCLYFNISDGSWCIPNYLDAISLTGAVSDLNLLDFSDIEISKANYYAELKSKNQTKLLVSSNKKTYTIDGIRTKDVIVHSGTDLESTNSELTILLPDKKEEYTIINPNKKQLLDLSMMYDDYYMTANSSNCDNIVFNPKGRVGINGNSGDFKISLTGNDNHISLPWYTITVIGSNTSNPLLTKTDTGYILEGDSLSNVTIIGKNDNETKKLTFTTTENKVLIGENNNNLTVSIDRDNDGIYETELKDGKDNINSNVELKDIKVKNARLSPDFNSSVYKYTSTVDNSVKKISLTPTLNKNTTATISVNGSNAVDFKAKHDVNLNVGKNVIKIIVSDNNGNESTYTITVNRVKTTSTGTQQTTNSTSSPTKENNTTTKKQTESQTTTTNPVKITSNIPHTGDNNFIRALTVCSIILTVFTVGYMILTRKKKIRNY